MRALLSLLVVAIVGMPVRGQVLGFAAHQQPQFVEVASGEWRVFPGARTAVAAREGRLSFRSRDGMRSIDLEFPVTWRVRAAEDSSTRFTAMVRGEAHSLPAARSITFEAPDETASLDVRFDKRSGVELTWSASTAEALIEVNLRFRDTPAREPTSSSALREEFTRQQGDWIASTTDSARLSPSAVASATTAPLVQKLLLASYIGGDQFDTVNDVATTPAGDLLLAGWTNSLDFPSTPGVVDPLVGPGVDAFLMSLDRSGTEIRFATFFGGNGFDEFKEIALARDGSTYLHGRTNSTDLPLSPTAFDTKLAGDDDNFVAHLSGDGSTFLGATYIGGTSSGTEVVDDFFLDPTDGSIVLAATVPEPFDWPTTAGSHAPQPGSVGIFECVVTRLSPDLSTLVASTYFESDILLAARVLSDGSVVFSVAGQLPPGLPERLPGGGVFPEATSLDDNALIRMSADLSTVIWSTWVPGIVYQIQEKSDGTLVLLGNAGPNFPTTPNAFNPRHDGFTGLDYFVCNITRDAEQILWSTYINSGSGNGAADSAIDDQGRVTFVSWLNSSSYPFTPDAYDSTLTAFGEAQITVLDATGSNLLYASSLGLNGTPLSMALDGCGGAYVAGSTNQPNVPTTPGAIDETFEGPTEGWLLRITTLNPWTDAGFALAGSNGLPRLAPSGPLCEGDPTSIEVSDALAGGSGFLVLGFGEAGTPLKGGVLVPTPDVFVPFSLDAEGGFGIAFDWPPGAASGFEFWLQAWMFDPGGLLGFSATNGVRGRTP